MNAKAASPGRPKSWNTGAIAVESQIRIPEYLSKKIAKETATVILTIHHAVCNAEGVANFAAL